MVGYKYNTLGETESSLKIVNTFFGLPHGEDCLRGENQGKAMVFGTCQLKDPKKF